MPWGAAVAAVGAYAASQAQSKGSSKAAKQDAEARKEIERMKRQWQLEDRKYNQDAVGAWSKFLDPSLVGPTVGQGPTSTADSTATPVGHKSDKAITDPNDPTFAPKPLEKASNAIPLQPMFRPSFGGEQDITTPPPSLWFPRQYPDYDPNNPAGR